MTRFEAPDRLAQALELLAGQPVPIVLAGGTDLWPTWTAAQGEAAPPARILSLHRLTELTRVDVGAEGLRIGACCTHSNLAQSQACRGHCPSLSAAAATIGAIQVQNRGTIGGNLVNASPAADLAPPLLAANAEVELASASGSRRVPVIEFYRGYRQLDLRADELLVAVRVPARRPQVHEFFRKIGTRRAQAIAKVSGACRISLAGDGSIDCAQLAFGSVGPVPLRLLGVEQWLMGQMPSDSLASAAARRAAEAVHPIDDLRSTAAYRAHVVERLVQSWVQAVGRMWLNPSGT